MIRQPIVLLILILALALLASCKDTRRHQVESLIWASAPAGFEIKQIDPRYVIKRMPDGTHTAEIPVYYLASENRYSIRRLLSTPKGNVLAKAIDNVAAWATSELRPEDPTRNEIIRIRADLPTDSILLDPTLTAGDEIASILRVIWAPDPKILSGLPEVRGQSVSDPAIGFLEGSEAASALFTSIGKSLEAMETLRSRWISRRDLRTESDRKRWMETFVSGAVFANAQYRLIVVAGFDATTKPSVVLTVGGNPLRTRSLRTQLESVYGGGLILRVLAANDILPTSPNAMTRLRPIPNASTIVLELPDSRTLVVTTPDAARLTLKFEQIADMLPPEPY